MPSEEGGSSRWSSDHLFLDQDAIPTIVETKRGDNTDLRRKVVGQMLDYAANAVVYWPAAYIRERFAVTCEECGLDPDEKLSEFLGEDADPEEFWRRADRNLRDGHIRLLFVADEIPTELQRIVEFLNEQMDRTVVLAVEIKQFVGGSQTGLVPRVIGRTAEAQQKKSSTPPGPTATVEEIIEAIKERSSEEAEIAQRILDWSKQYFATKCSQASFLLEFKYNPKTFHPVSIGKNGKLTMNTRNIRSTRPFDIDEDWLEFRRRLDEIPVNFTEKDSFPSIRLSELANEDALVAFLQTIAWSVERVNVAQQEQPTRAQPQSA